MKRITTAVVLFATALFLAQAKATKKVDPYDEKKMHPTDRSGVEKFFGTNRYDVLDELSIYIQPIVGKIKAKVGNFIYRRGTDVAGFRIQYDTTAYTFELAREQRQACCDAIDKYMDDFENKRLDKKLKRAKTRKVYGSVLAYEEFGIALKMMNYKAKPIADFGYAFVDGSPYFVIHVEKAKNLALEGNVSDKGNSETIILNYYFTRAQAKKLRDFICEENISLFHAQENEALKDLRSDAEVDDYEEADEDITVIKK